MSPISVPSSSTVVVFVRSRPGLLNQATAFLERHGFRLSAIALGGTDARGWARLTMQLHEDDVSAVMPQLEHHLAQGPKPALAPAVTEMPYRWQADGVCDDDAA